MGNFNILEKIKQYRTVSIIGMDKNVGKTTVLNHILGEARGKLTLGLTSIGRDGEDKDRVIGTDKPRIFIESGNFIATAKECLFNGDITKEIIETTGINTPMGEVIIAKALSDGYVELGGPSVNNYMKEICDKLSNLGSELILVDGALSRKTMASPAVTEACILSTGASLNRSMNKVVEMTSLSVKLLSLEKEADKDVMKMIEKELSHSRIGIIYKNKETKNLEAATSLEAAKEIVEELNDDVSHVLIRGIVSDKLLEDILKSTDKYKGVIFLVEDGTKLFLKNETFERFVKMGGILKAVNKVNLVCVTCNPRSPSGYEFNKNIFLEKLSQAVSLPVIDVKA